MIGFHLTVFIYNMYCRTTEMSNGERERERERGGRWRRGRDGVKYYYKLTLILTFKVNQCVKLILNWLKVS